MRQKILQWVTYWVESDEKCCYCSKSCKHIFQMTINTRKIGHSLPCCGGNSSTGQKYSYWIHIWRLSKLITQNLKTPGFRIVNTQWIFFSETIVESTKTSTKRPKTENHKKERTLDIKDIFRKATVKQYKPIFFKKETIVID